jgi:hypothetical protein
MIPLSYFIFFALGFLAAIIGMALMRYANNHPME